MVSNQNNGLRDENGSLIGGLDVFDYIKGMEDSKSGTPPPELTSPSYDLGRQRAAEQAELRADILREIERKSEEDERRMREVLRDYPDILAKYEAKMEKSRSKGNG